MSRRGLALVLVLFCLPLFVGLRSLDLETDEAIYSFAVERMLADGEWLQPKSSPSDTVVFLEKPPLKFWIVAAPIKLGLLPNDEFGLRFWDAVAGLVAFAYVFAIGSRLAGPVCGAVAVLLLFVHGPLLFEHGLRTNNMEGMLLLAYCGGVFHFLEWGGVREVRRARHAAAAAVYFAVGFLTKFVAIVFLPMVLGLGALLVPATRLRLWHDRATLVKAGGLALAIILPWFIYAQVMFGWEVMHIMLGEHVLTRFGGVLVPDHVQPWSYYVTRLWESVTWGQVQWFVPAGLVVLAVQAVRRRWFEGLVILLWAVLPLALISLGTSKLYHYAYPFLPPIMLAVGYMAALIMMLAPVVLRRLLEAVEDLLARGWPAVAALARRPAVQRVASALIVFAAGLAVWALFFGQARLQIGATTLFKSGGVVRPIALILIAGLIARRSGRIAPLTIALALSWWLPVDAYRATITRLTEARHPLRDLSDCVNRLDYLHSPQAPAGLLVDTDSSMWHPITFYFRRIQPWDYQPTASPERLARTLVDGSFQPSLVQERRYQDYLTGPLRERFAQTGTPPMVGLFEYALVLPGPFAACSPEAALRER